MRKTVPVLLLATLVLSGCGGGARMLNPMNWFGRTEARAASPAPTTADGARNPLIPWNAETPVENRVPVARIDTLVVERVPGGAVIRVTATAAYQGSHDVELVAQPGGIEGGVARYTLLADLPSDPRTLRVGTDAARHIDAAVYLSDIELAEVGSIEVISATNILSTRR